MNKDFRLNGQSPEAEDAGSPRGYGEAGNREDSPGWKHSGFFPDAPDLKDLIGDKADALNSQITNLAYDDEDWMADAEREEAIARRSQRRRNEQRLRNLAIVLTFILAALALLLIYSKVLLPRVSFLPWPSFLGGRPASYETGTISETELKVIHAEAETSTPEAAPPFQESETTPAVENPAVTPQAAALNTDSASIQSQAALLAAQYDYDGAIDLLSTIPGYESDPDITALISQYQTSRDACVPVDVNTVPHVFYHSLLNDTGRAFDVNTLGKSGVDGYNAWMVTIEEFDQLVQRFYDSGYVYVRLRDLVKETIDADGTVHFTVNTDLRLPPGKKALVLSIDDLSYYHCYAAAGFPEKLVLDADGQVKCLYVDANGNESIGDYDVVPRLETFLAAHPDGCYKGARGLLAMTGYNGVFGYRTDMDYLKRERLMDDQKAWLNAHPDFDFNAEVEDAKRIANALKDAGWEFASHTWGHLSVTDKTAEGLRVDNEKWLESVEPITGPVDTIIFAHGNDIGSWEGYSDSNEKYAYYNSVGYHFYCNVDASGPYWVQITDRYVRQGRIDLDGYRLYECQQGNDHSLSQLIDTSGIFDASRPTPVVAVGMG